MFPALCSLPRNIEQALEKVAEWTGVVVYIFRYSLEHYEHYKWTIEKPAILVNKKRCRYYITIALIEKNGKKYVDRISSNNGCNCMLTPPNVKCVKGTIFYLNNFKKHILVQEQKLNLYLFYGNTYIIPHTLDYSLLMHSKAYL